MSTVHRFAKLIDELYKQPAQQREQVLFFVGNGIQRVANILYHDSINALAKSKGIHDEDELIAYRWRLFEFARYYTTYTLPSFAHCHIHRLVSDKVCSDVVTTNYDLFFDSIWKKYPELEVQMNPTLLPGEYHWDNYRSQYQAGKPRYWKIHGSLSHVVFREESGSGHLIHKLPDIAIPTNIDSIAKSFNLDTAAPFMGFHKFHYPATYFPNHDVIKSSFEPFIDWTYHNNRSLFQREISAITDHLRNPSNLAGIFLIGFTGYYNESNDGDPWNEELTPVIHSVLNDGKIPVTMAVHEAQYEGLHDSSKQSKLSLMLRMQQRGSLYKYRNSGKFLDDVLRMADRFPRLSSKNTMSKWRHFYYLRNPEAKHA